MSNPKYHSQLIINKNIVFILNQKNDTHTVGSGGPIDYRNCLQIGEQKSQEGASSY